MRKEKGITLIALVITIIVLLILAGVTIATLTGDNGLLTKAGEANSASEIAEEKDIISISAIQAQTENDQVSIQENSFREALNQNSREGNKASLLTSNAESFVVKFESNRCYILYNDGKISNAIKLEKDEYAGDITKGGKYQGQNYDDAYRITCIEDLIEFSIMTNGGNTNLNIPSNFSFQNKYVIMTRTLDFESIFSYNDFASTKYGDLNEDGTIENIKEELTNKNKIGIGFTPIGGKRSFNGIFDGNNYEIKNIYEYAIRNQYLGLFSGATGCTIKNLKISGSFEIPKENPSVYHTCSAGGIAAFPGNINVYNCTNNVKIRSKGFGVGGIIGKTYSGGNIINCRNTADIENYNGEGAAGIIGRHEGTVKIYNSYNIGNIKDPCFGGGIVGYYCAGSTRSLDIINVYNKGFINKCGWGNGGIIGANSSGGKINIKNAFNLGTIEQNNNKSGAFLGCLRNQPSELNISNCFYVKTTNERAVVGKSDELYGVTLCEIIENETIKNVFNEYIESNPDNFDLVEWKKWKINNTNLETE